MKEKILHLFLHPETMKEEFKNRLMKDEIRNVCVSSHQIETDTTKEYYKHQGDPCAIKGYQFDKVVLYQSVRKEWIELLQTVFFWKRFK